jgi:hypothetical protein
MGDQSTVGCWELTFGAKTENIDKHKSPKRIIVFLLLILLSPLAGWLIQP